MRSGICRRRKRRTVSRVFLAAVMLATGLGLVVLSGCSKELNGRGQKFQIPWFDREGNYSLQNIEISTLSDPRHVRGEAASVLIDPVMSAQGIEGGGPTAKFVQSGDVLVPSDAVSMQSVALYAHLEKMMLLDRRLGIHTEMSYPVKIGFATRDIGIVNNALFNGMVDGFYVLHYDIGRLPLSVNASVLAHEHFHRIFWHLTWKDYYKKVFKIADDRAAQLQAFQRSQGHHHHISEFETNTCRRDVRRSGGYNFSCHEDREYEAFLIRALNEGMADVWQWIYTGETAFMEKSFPDPKGNRRLKGPAVEIAEESLRSLYLENARGGYCTCNNPYIYGTQLARLNYRIFEERFRAEGLDLKNFEHRLKVGQNLVAGLRDLRMKFMTKNASAPPSLRSLVLPIIERQPAQFSCTHFVTTLGRMGPLPKDCK